MGSQAVTFSRMRAAEIRSVSFLLRSCAQNFKNATKRTAPAKKAMKATGSNSRRPPGWAGGAGVRSTVSLRVGGGGSVCPAGGIVPSFEPSGIAFESRGAIEVDWLGRNHRRTDFAEAMIGRRAAAAGIATKLGNHSFRATGITAYLKNGGTLEKAAQMANQCFDTHNAALLSLPRRAQS